MDSSPDPITVPSFRSAAAEKHCSSGWTPGPSRIACIAGSVLPTRARCHAPPLPGRARRGSMILETVMETILERKEATMQKINPCLWFDTQAEEAAKFYVSLLDDSEVTNVQYLE